MLLHDPYFWQGGDMQLFSGDAVWNTFVEQENGEKAPGMLNSVDHDK